MRHLLLFAPLALCSCDLESDASQRFDASSTDASPTDLLELDTPQLDVSTADASRPDAVPADATRSDAHVSDTAPADTTPADTSQSDTTPADTSQSDTTPADTSQSDTIRSDTSRPDVPGAECWDRDGGLPACGLCGVYVPTLVTAADTVLLRANSFWDTAALEHTAYRAEIDLALQGMPARLRDADLTSAADRALQLSWAVTVANALTATAVVVEIPSCEYDFSGIAAAHPDATGSHVDFLPKLYIARDQLTLSGVPGAAAPLLRYSGVGADGVNHGRVLIMVPSGRSGVRIEHLALRGDHQWAFREEAAYYLHENNAALLTARDRRLWHGVVMVGLGGGANDVTIESVRIEQLARAGIAAVGGVTVRHSTIAGVLPIADREEFVGYVATTLQQVLMDALGGAKPGMGFHSAISQAYAYSPVTIEGCTLSNAIEGVVAGGLTGAQPWRIAGNRIEAIADHGIYILGTLREARIEDNELNMIQSSAIKLGGRSCLPEESSTGCATPTDPLDERTAAGAHRSVVSGNHFRLNKRAAIQISGTLNTVRDNQVMPYDAAEDPSTGDWYTPFIQISNSGADNVYPDLFCSVAGGQTISVDGFNSYVNHCAFNLFADNTKGAQPFRLLFTQHVNQRDRSIGMNTVAGAGQEVYVAARLDSRFAPAVAVADGARLIAGPPADCADCRPDEPAFRSHLTPIWIEPLVVSPAAGAIVPHALIRYDTEGDLFLIGENGVHERIATGASEPSVVAVADLDADGTDEIYLQLGSEVTIFGARPYTDVTARAVAEISGAARWTYYGGSQTVVAAEAAQLRSDRPTQLVTAFSGSRSLYGSTLSGGEPVIGEIIYTGADDVFPSAATVRRLRGADLSALGEESVATDEIYGAFSNGAIVGIHWDGAGWARESVYSGDALISVMAPGRLRSGEDKARMYHRFAEAVVYETPPSVATLPAFSSGASFYDGAYTTDLLLAGDLDQDGLEEMLNHYIELPGRIYFGEETAPGVVSGNAGHFYDGAGALLQISRTEDGHGEARTLALFADSTTIFLSEGLRAQGRDWVDLIQRQVRSERGL